MRSMATKPSGPTSQQALRISLEDRQVILSTQREEAAKRSGLLPVEMDIRWVRRGETLSRRGEGPIQLPPIVGDHSRAARLSKTRDTGGSIGILLWDRAPLEGSDRSREPFGTHKETSVTQPGAREVQGSIAILTRTLIPRWTRLDAIEDIG